MIRRVLADDLPDGRRGYYPASRSDIPRRVTQRNYEAEAHGRTLAIGFLVVLAASALIKVCL